MDFPPPFWSALVSIIAHDKAMRSGRVRSCNISKAITFGTVTALHVGDAQASMSGVNRRWLRPAGKRAISIADGTDPGD